MSLTVIRIQTVTPVLDAEIPIHSDITIFISQRDMENMVQEDGWVGG